LKALYEKAATRGKETMENFTGTAQFAAIEKRLAAIEEKLGISPAPATETPTEEKSEP